MSYEVGKYCQLVKQLISVKIQRVVQRHDHESDLRGKSTNEKIRVGQEVDIENDAVKRGLGVARGQTGALRYVVVRYEVVLGKPVKKGNFAKNKWSTTRLN